MKICKRCQRLIDLEEMLRTRAYHFEEISKKFGICKRQISREIDKLKKFGLDIKRKGDGYYI